LSSAAPRPPVDISTNVDGNFGSQHWCCVQVERNVQKVSDAYETLAEHSQKRENLEKLVRLKLDSEIGRLNDVNQQVQGKLVQLLL